MTHIKLFPFRYRPKSSTSGYVRRLSAVAAKNSLSLQTVSETVYKGLSSRDLAKIERGYWNASARALLRAQGIIPLNIAKRKLLARPVPLKVYLYRTPDKSVSLKVDFTTSVRYPAISAQIWRESRLQFVDGWIEIKSNGRKAASARAIPLIKDVRESLGPIRWRTNGHSVGTTGR